MNETHEPERIVLPELEAFGPPGQIAEGEPDNHVCDVDLTDSAPVTVIAYGDDEQTVFEKRIESLREIPPLREKYKIVWVNIDGRCTDAVLECLGQIFGLHPLALEDVTNHRQRAKFEEYKDHIFAVARMVSMKENVETEQLSLFLGKDYVVTFQEEENGDCFGELRERLRRSKGRTLKTGPDYLAYCLFDAVVDGYFPVLEEVNTRLTAVEDYIDAHPVAEPSSSVPSQIHDLRRNIITLRQTISAMRESLTPMSRKTLELIQEETRMHFRDCYDHAMRMIDSIDLYRETAITVRELYQTSINNRSNELQHRNNEVMKVLTIITTLFIPPTLIAGIYGMNFNPEKSPWNMPELNWFLGYPFALGMMLLMVGGLLWYLYRRGFLSRSQDVSVVPQIQQSPKLSHVKDSAAAGGKSSPKPK